MAGTRQGHGVTEDAEAKISPASVEERDVKATFSGRGFGSPGGWLWATTMAAVLAKSLVL